ncbi:MAG: ABC transporter ATP-binding protein [Acetobacteraceae bacterium]
MTIIRIDRLSKAFGGVQAVDAVSLTVEDKEFFTLLGPSGCGKTTLLRMIAGFCDPDCGAIFFDDQRIDRLPAHRRDIGMVFQDYAVFPNLTVEQNVLYGLRARRTPHREAAERAKAALERVRLGGLGKRWPHQLSGGQLQRVAIARSLVIEPMVLLFDEPLSNLDAQLRVQMRVEIRQLQKTLGLTAVYVTHDQEEALAVSDRIAVLQSGRVEQIGPPESIYGSPRTAFVASFMGTTNMIPGVAGTFDGETTRVNAGPTPLWVKGRVATEGEHVVLSLRPEALHLVENTDQGRARLRARLEMREFLGPLVRLHLALADGTPIRASLLSGSEYRLQQGDELEFAYDPAQVLGFAVQ